MAVNLAPSQDPDDGGTLASGTRGTGSRAGTGGAAGDVTNEPGQYPVGGWGDAIFGGPLPQGTGAPGSAGAPRSADPTNEPGQLTEGISGTGPPQTDSTGAPGSTGADNSTSGADAIRYTRPGSFLSGTYKSDVVQDNVSGSQDATQANDSGYSSGGPQLPGLRGNEPQAGQGPFQPGGGRVMRGGRMNGQ
jgi:hypothetical protein